MYTRYKENTNEQNGGNHMGDTLTLKAPAKINLGLDVLGKRDNGYHEVRMVMQSIGLYDNVSLEKIEEPGIFLETNLYYLPVDEKNIAYKAAKLLRDEFSISQGVKIKLEKHIPVAAGMAGGSTNAAAVLEGMNTLFSLGLTQKELMERGVKLGADVPYCIMKGTALAEGIGEILSPLPSLPECYVLIAKPGISVSTKEVYEELDSKEIPEHPDIDGILEGLASGNLEKIVSAMGNVLERVTVQKYPVINEIKQAMKEAGAMNAMMSGSGPTVFGIFKDLETAEFAQREIQKMKIAKDICLTNVHNTRRS